MNYPKKYPKIQTVWKREETKPFKIIEGDLTKPEFGNINKWLITEKIDGTNIRVTYNRISDVDGINPPFVEFDGKTDDAEIPKHLYAALAGQFNVRVFESVFPGTVEKPAPSKVILFGEGYGIEIQNGGLYRDDAGFILFDVWVDGWWLNRESVEDIAKKFNIPVVPVRGIMTLDEAVTFVKSKPMSAISNKPRTIEGIVARCDPILLFRDGEPLMWKLKVKDYARLG